MANISNTFEWVEDIYIIQLDDFVQGGEDGVDNLPHKQLAQRTAYLKNRLDGYKESNDKAVQGLQQSLDDLDIPPDLSSTLEKETRERKAADNALRGSAPEEINLGSLLEKLKELENRPAVAIPVGGIFETTKAYKTGAELAKDIGYGTWKRFAEGKVTVGVSTKNSDPVWTKTINKTFGEYEHQLTLDEMPTHNHFLNASSGHGYGDYSISGELRETVISESSIGDTGGDLPHNNTQPSVVVGKWLRTA